MKPLICLGAMACLTACGAIDAPNEPPTSQSTSASAGGTGAATTGGGTTTTGTTGTTSMTGGTGAGTTGGSTTTSNSNTVSHVPTNHNPSGGTGPGVTTGGIPGCTTDTWTNYAQAQFTKWCSDCHALYSQYTSVVGDKTIIEPRLADGSMPRGASLPAADRTRIIRWLDCNMPL